MFELIYLALTRHELVGQRNMYLAMAEELLADIERDGSFASEAMLAQANLAATIAVVYTGLVAEKGRVEDSPQTQRVATQLGTYDKR